MKRLLIFAEQGFGDAQSNLGAIYAAGRGVPRNHVQAVKWYRVAAVQGLVEAQFKLGVRKVTDAVKHLNREILDESVWKRFDSAGRLFWNMNTAADYEEARRILEAERA